MKHPIHTDKAPPCSGTYSQAIKTGNTIYLAGQIPIDPATKELISKSMHEQAKQVFENLKAVTEAAGGNLDSIVKLNVYLMTMDDFSVVNETMQQYFQTPYPARTTIAVAGLPKGARIEVDAIMVV